MALSSSLVWEARASTGNDNWGGGFNATAAGTDRSQANAAFVVIDNATITTSITANVITFTGYTPTSADVGNVVQMLTGTNVTAGFYEITAQTATTWTVTGAVNLPTSGTTTNATGNMGGTLATLTKLAAAMVNSNKAFVTGSFTSTAGITFNGNVTPSTTVNLNTLIGYTTIRGDGGRATLTLQTTAGLTGITVQSGWSVQNIAVDCANLGTSTGFACQYWTQFINCKVANFKTTGFQVTGVSGVVYRCEATGGGSAGTAAINCGNVNTSVLECFIHDNACPAIILSTDATVVRCVIANNTGGSSDAVRAGYHANVSFNTIHGNGRDGIRGGAGAINYLWLNNILSNNGGYGINNVDATAMPASMLYDGNAFYSNTSGARNLMDSTTGILGVGAYVNTRDVTLTGSPYVGPTTGASANFALNNNAGAGTACQKAASPGSWPGNTGTTGYLDIGAVQHPDSGGPHGILIVRQPGEPAFYE